MSTRYSFRQQIQSNMFGFNRLIDICRVRMETPVGRYPYSSSIHEYISIIYQYLCKPGRVVPGTKQHRIDEHVGEPIYILCVLCVWFDRHTRQTIYISYWNVGIEQYESHTTLLGTRSTSSFSVVTTTDSAGYVDTAPIWTGTPRGLPNANRRCLAREPLEETTSQCTAYWTIWPIDYALRSVTKLGYCLSIPIIAPWSERVLLSIEPIGVTDSSRAMGTMISFFREWIC